jgi:PAS domain-containing protein
MPMVGEVPRRTCNTEARTRQAIASGATPPGESFDRMVVDHVADGVYYVDRERLITYWNPSAERLTGYAASEVIGRYCHDNILCHVDDAGTPLCFNGCPLAATMEDGLPREADV